MDFNKVLMHGIYVAGMTMFGSLTNAWTDGILSNNEIIYSLISAFISGGSAFFISFGIEKGYENTINQSLKASSTSLKGKITRCVMPICRARSFIYLV